MGKYQVDQHIYCASSWGKEKVAKRVFEEIVAENFLNLINDINIKIQKLQQIPSDMNSKSSHYNQIVESQRLMEKWMTNYMQGISIRLSSDFATEFLEAKRVWYFQSIEKKNSTLYLTKLSFMGKGEIKAFPDEQKLREFIISRS